MGQGGIKMAIKIIAVDLDGTLLSSGNVILPETEKVLRVASESGIKVVLATGRPLSGALPFAQQLGLSGDEQYAIVFNGAVVQSLDGRVLMSQELNYQDFNNMLRFQRLSHVDVHFETTKYFLTCDHDLSVQMQINAALTNNIIKVRNRKDIPKILLSIKLVLLLLKVVIKLINYGIVYPHGHLIHMILYAVLIVLLSLTHWELQKGMP